MVAVENSQPVLLIKKLGGMLMLVVGIVLTALGAYSQSNGLTMAGIALLAIGLLLLILKIVRRNQPSP